MYVGKIIMGYWEVVGIALITIFVFGSALMFVAIRFQLGWRYGTTTEDVLTGQTIHKKGWRSILCTMEPPAFLGCAPSGGPAAMTQQKRWATGLLEILLSKNCPIFATLFGKLQLRQCFAYLWIFSWGLRSVPELCYATLPVYCIITNSQFFPKVMTNQNHPNLSLS
jgi:cellulose synthase/poly-beta-1,6-N-acetylglucosamine synthase-like glycosyltransferase